MSHHHEPEHQHNHDCKSHHEHEHHHDNGHQHEHRHEHGQDCCCHEHNEERGSGHCHEEKNIPQTKSSVRIYHIENLDCANCAAKIEKKISALPDVEYASITFATKQLRVASPTKDLLPLLESVCRSIESEVSLTPLEGRPAASDRARQQTDDRKQSQKEIFFLLLGAVLFLVALCLNGRFPFAAFLMFVISYLVLGLEIILAACKNLFKGNIFDENFLMSIATIAAFCIREFPEAVGVMLFYRIGEWFEHRAVDKSRRQIMEALDLRPETVLLLSGEEIQTIPAKDAKPGDILSVRPGDRIPLDGTVIHGESRLDTSPVTGEPVPRSVKEGEPVLSGCLNLSGALHIRVEKRLEESMVSRILDSVENAAASKPKMDRFITRFSRIYTPVVVLLAAAVAVIPSLLTGDWNYWIYTAITFLVISCPCALVLSVPLSFFSGIGAGSRQGILFKGGVSLEVLKNIKVVIMDKTGTITKGNFVVQECELLQEDVTEETLLRLAASCEGSSTHPIAVSICEAAAQKGLSPIAAENIQEIPGHGIRALVETQEVLCGNRKLMEQYQVTGLEHYQPSAQTEVLIAVNQQFCGIIRIADTLKEDAKEAIAALKQKHIYTVMLTGDSKAGADSVAQETGIDRVYAKLLPEDKLERLKQIRSEKGTVMFVGDGINDAPVLAGADVGAAMGTGADAAIEAADVVFMTSSVKAIPESIRIARFTGRIAMQNVIFALAVKALVMILGLAGFASMWVAVFADSGVAMLCVLNSIRILYQKK